MIRNSCVFWIWDLYFFIKAAEQQERNTQFLKHFLLPKSCFSMHAWGWGAPYMFPESTPEAEFLDEIQTKVWRVYLLAIHRHLYNTALPWGYYLFKTHATSYYKVIIKEKERKPMVLQSHTETSILRTLRNLKENVCSWIRLQVPACVSDSAYRRCGEFPVNISPGDSPYQKYTQSRRLFVSKMWWAGDSPYCW